MSVIITNSSLVLLLFLYGVESEVINCVYLCEGRRRKSRSWRRNSWKANRCL